jgi:hypothetical protein
MDLNPALWLALFPVTFAIHFAEEFWGGEGYVAYLYRLRGVRVTARRFFWFQFAGFVGFCLAGVVSLALDFPYFMILLLSGFVLCNGITHTLTAIAHREYGPGLIASMVLWMPLGAVSIYSLYGQMPLNRWLIATAIGLGINGLVALVTLRGGKLKKD